MFYSKRLQEITDIKASFRVLLVLMITPLLVSSLYAEDSMDYEDSVVMIMSVRQDYDYTTPWKKTPMSRGVGSGFIIEGNLILTNAHNVANQRYIEVKKQNLAQRYPAVVQFVGHDCDLAIITVPDSTFFEGTRPLGFGPIPKINTTVQTCGFPMGGRQVSITKGVVSRLETSVYSHSQAARHLVVQTDAAINPGNSGGPVFQNDKVVGVAFQGLQTADNIGYMIPTSVIAHFLKDIEDGTYDGFGSLGISLFPGLHNPSYKRYLKIADDQDGVVVMDILLNGTCQGVLEKGDVVSKIDDFNIDNDGRITIDGLTLELSEIMDRKQIGQDVELTYFRNGKKNVSAVKIDQNELILPWKRFYDTTPAYRVFAGMTFVKVNRNFLESWGRNWLGEVPFTLRYLFVDSNQLNKSRDRKEYVVLSEILPDEITAYSGGYKNQVIETVNDIQINKLDDLDQAFQTDIDGYWVVKFMGNDSPMVINAEQARTRHGFILNKYQVPSM